MNLMSPKGGRDTVYLERHGIRSGPYKCNFSAGKFTLFYKELDVLEGDKVVREIPGREERHTILEVHYSPGLSSISPHYALTISKDSAISKPDAGTTTNHINIHGSTGIQIGDHNVQHLEAGLKELLSAIDNSEGEPAAKEEAKGKLKGFLEHPLTASAVGAGLPALMALFGVAS